ncbi:MAG TPA: cold shock domain-containing protein [Bacteroidales bacterium]|nr:cold shock domain-containing protein [Bacteroidales bacterium]HPT11241.1 cold shock domain-containing protein [Bacteroidales bacterium]
MGRSQETSNKKEVRNKKDKKRKEKEQKRAKKKTEGTRSFDDMIAYVNEFGMISTTPPDADKRSVVDVESIQLSATRNSPESVADRTKTGVVSMFNNQKGYGFIRETNTNRSIFVHMNSLIDIIKEGDTVSFEVTSSPKGDSAQQVRLIKP